MSGVTSMLQEVFLEHLRSHFSKRDSSSAQNKHRVRFWEQFERKGLPTRDDEVFRYVKLRKLYAQEFAEAEKETALSLPGKNAIVFINGRFSPGHSTLQGESKKITILPLEEGFRSYGTFLNNQMLRTEKTEGDPFAILNGALSEQGAFVYIPPKTLLSEPLEILYLFDAKEQGVLASPRVHFFIGAHAHVKIYAKHRTLNGKRYFCNQYNEFSLEEGARVSLYQSDVGAGAHAWVLQAMRAYLKKDAFFDCTGFTAGAQTVRNDYKVFLTGENAEVSLNGLALLKDWKEAHTNVWIQHQAPHCRSQQLFKSVVDDHATTSFEGKIYVESEAQKTDAFQLNNNLLLSEHAHAYSKPNLEIFADDVKASHGATCGQLNKEQLFYLQARGLGEEEAREILIACFAEEVLSKFPADFRNAAIYQT